MSYIRLKNPDILKLKRLWRVLTGSLRRPFNLHLRSSKLMLLIKNFIPIWPQGICFSQIHIHCIQWLYYTDANQNKFIAFLQLSQSAWPWNTHSGHSSLRGKQIKSSLEKIRKLTIWMVVVSPLLCCVPRLRFNLFTLSTMGVIELSLSYPCGPIWTASFLFLNRWSAGFDRQDAKLWNHSLLMRRKIYWWKKTKKMKICFLELFHDSVTCQSGPNWFFIDNFLFF